MKKYGLPLIVMLLLLCLCPGSRSQFPSVIAASAINDALIPTSALTHDVALPDDALKMSTPSPSIVPSASNLPASSAPPPPSGSPTPTITPAQTGTPSPSLTPEVKTITTPAPTPIAPPVEWYESKEKGLKVPILMYHNLLSGDDKGNGLNVSEKAFEDQLSTLKSYGYHTITFDELYNHYMYTAELPENPLIITFDDGYKSNYTLGFPLLKKYGMKACIFMITNAIGSTNFMTKDQLKEVTDSGLVEIQCHSVSHSFALSSMKKEAMDTELSASRSLIESITGKAANVFCYPYGRYSGSLIDKLISHEYIFSVTTQTGCASKKAHPFLLPRIRVNGADSGKGLKKRVDNFTGRVTKFTGLPEATPEPSMSPSPDPSTPPIPQETPIPSGEPSPTPSELPGVEYAPDTTQEPNGTPAPSSDPVTPEPLPSP